jgi:hypothetical protein
MVPLAGCDTVGAENDALALGNFIQVLDKNCTLALERFEHEAVVDYLMAHIEWRPISA